MLTPFEEKLYDLYAAVEDALPSLTGILSGFPSSRRAENLQAVKRAD